MIKESSPRPPEAKIQGRLEPVLPSPSLPLVQRLLHRAYFIERDGFTYTAALLREAAELLKNSPPANVRSGAS